MAHYTFYPFEKQHADGYVTKTLAFLKETQAAIEIPGPHATMDAKIGSADVLHVLGHGHNFNGDELDANLTAKPSIQANDLAAEIAKIIGPEHRLVMLDCCFAMGQYFQKNWTEGKSGQFLARVVATALGKTHAQLIIGGSANATVAPKEELKGTAVGYEIGTKFSLNSTTTKVFAGKYQTTDATMMVIPRLLFYVDNQGKWVNADGSPSNGPQKLW